MDARALAELYAGSLCLWREARGEPRAGKAAVAWTFIRRSRKKGWWNRKRDGSIVAVVAAPMQYSSMTDPHDAQLVKFPFGEESEWSECVNVVENVLAGTEPDPTPGADSYYAKSMKTPPPWADEEHFVGEVGAHRFYRLLG